MTHVLSNPTFFWITVGNHMSEVALSTICLMSPPHCSCRMSLPGPEHLKVFVFSLHVCVCFWDPMLSCLHRWQDEMDPKDMLARAHYRYINDITVHEPEPLGLNKTLSVKARCCIHFACF